MLARRLESLIEKRCTIIGVGPVSKNCVDAVIELANDYSIPIILIASRRQVEAKEFSGGYVNNWSTEEFSRYVFDRDKTGNVILARDHGGPWQNTFEVERQLSFRQAMDSSKKSFQVDIESGFEMIHIDPSIDIFKRQNVDEILLRLFELYEFCYLVAQKKKRKLLFEIGTEEQDGSVQDLEQLEYVLSQTTKFCVKNKFPKPFFVVAQTGTKVMEMQNVGSLESPFRIDRELPAEIQLPRIIELCNKYNIFLKEHNADYLKDETLKWHPKLRIHAANVAPEFGLTETKALVGLLNQNSLKKLADRIVGIAYESKKWKKWVMPNSKAGFYEKALIAGHYIFTNKEFLGIKKKAQSVLAKKNIIIDEFLKNEIKKAIMRYLKNFNLLSISR